MDMDPDLDDEEDMFKKKGDKMNDEELLRQMLQGGMMMNLPGQTPMNTHADEDHLWVNSLVLIIMNYYIVIK